MTPKHLRCLNRFCPLLQYYQLIRSRVVFPFAKGLNSEYWGLFSFGDDIYDTSVGYPAIDVWYLGELFGSLQELLEGA